uniref:EGF-like domain-containing protein n=1 Tax=Parastrongyloides trichosuri TaxID=131310 RepID=A0A0N4ZXM6_PARTI
IKLLLASIELSNNFDNINQDDRNKRSIRNETKYKWNTPIKYFIANGLKDSHVQQAIDNIQNNTCIKFIKSNDKIINEVGINFLSVYFCALSDLKVDQNRTTPTYIFVGYSCFYKTFVIQSLIHLALGVKSETDRVDSNLYIYYNKTNIKPNVFIPESRDDPKKTTTYGIEFDYGSLTHYVINDARKDPNIPIITSKKYPQYYAKMLPQRVMASFNDYKLLNCHYCNYIQCEKKPSPCENYGYLDPKSYPKNICNCPNGYSGLKCQKIRRTQDKCPCSRLIAYNETKEIKLFGKKSCYMSITTSKSRYVSLSITISSSSEVTPCTQDSGIEVKYRKEKGAMGLCLCKEYKSPVNIVSQTNNVLIHYHPLVSDFNATIKYKEVNEAN